MITSAHRSAIRVVYLRLLDCPHSWVVTGSLGMALQGVPVEVHDIDLQTDRDGAYEIERRLSEYLKQPVHYVISERIRSYLGKLEIDSIQVEIMGALQKRLEDGSWEEPVDVKCYRRWVEIEAMKIPVVQLEYEQRAYQMIGRVEKAALLRDWLHKQAPANDRG